MTDIELKAMANRMKLQRKNLSYTQEGFSEVIDISIGSYTKIENAFQKPSLDTLIKIAKTLGVSLDYLVFGEDETNIENTSNVERLMQICENIDTEKLCYVRDFLNQINNLK